MLISELSQDPYGGRVVLLVYGRAKIGKTTTILKMVSEQDQLLYLMSVDRGTMKVRLEPKKYQGKMVISYPTGLHEIRSDMDALSERIKKLVAKVGADKVWFVIDTVSHLQDMLLTEARKIDVTNPSLRQSEKKKDSSDMYVRDMLTRPDYGINLGHMSEAVNLALSMPCNVVFVALDKIDKDRKDRPVHIPRMSGQAGGKVLGDVDAILFMDLDAGGGRVFHCTPTSEHEAGDRSGNLNAVEPVDLPFIRRKMLGIEQPKLEAVAQPQPAAK